MPLTMFAAARLGSVSTSSDSLARSRVEAAGFAAGGSGEGEGACQGRAVHRQPQIACGESGRGRFEAARQRGAAIGERLTNGHDFGGALRRAEARPVAKKRKVGGAELDIAAEFRRRASFEIAFAPQSALPGQAEVVAQMQRRAGLGSQRHAGVRQRLGAKDDRLGRDLRVDRHPALPTLKRRRRNPGQQCDGARGRHAVFALAAHERVDVGLFGFQTDAEPGRRAEGEGRVSLRPNRPFFRPEPKLRAANGRVMEVGVHLSGDAPRYRVCLSGHRSRQVAAPANRRPASPPAASPSSMPSNLAAGQLGPASTSMRSGVPSGPGFSEANLKRPAHRQDRKIGR